MNATAGRATAAIGAVLAIVALWLDALVFGPISTSYWDLDGTFAAFGLGAAVLALIAAASSTTGTYAADGWLCAIGAVLVGFYGWFPAATAFNDWKHTGAGLWLAFAGAILIAVGAAAALLSTGAVHSTPAGATPPALAAGLGIALVFPSIWLDAENGATYWNGPLGHSLGIVLLILAIAAGLVWAATAFGGVATHGIDAVLTLILLGLVAVDPIASAFNQFGDVGTGGWLALAGGILAAGGTWAARGAELAHTAAAPA